MIFKSHNNPLVKAIGHAVVDLKGTNEEVLHIRALGKDLDIDIRIDDAKTGIVIQTRDGMHRQAI